MPGNKPTHNLSLVTKERNTYGNRVYTNVGKAWEMSEGGFSIRLNPGVVLDWRMSEQFYLNLSRIVYEPPPSPRNGYSEDDIPF